MERTQGRARLLSCLLEQGKLPCGFLPASVKSEKTEAQAGVRPGAALPFLSFPPCLGLPAMAFLLFWASRALGLSPLLLKAHCMAAEQLEVEGDVNFKKC